MVPTSQVSRRRVASVVAVVGVLTLGQALSPPISARSGLINVSTETQLQAAMRQLSSGMTIVLAPGVYRLSRTLWVNGTFTGVTIRGASSDRNAVVLQGPGMTSDSANVPHGIWAGGNVKGLRIENLTIRGVPQHGIVFNAGTQAPVVHNVRLLDAGQQLLKSNPNGSGGVNDGLVEKSSFEYTTTAPSSYTNGIDVHTGRRWIIRNNVFRNIVGPPNTLAGPAVLVWNGARETLTERNLFVNCARGIAYGLQDRSGNDHSGGIIRNNVVMRAAGQPGDVGISLNDSNNTKVLNNTVFLSGTYSAGIEYRFSGTTGVLIANNLTDGTIARRNNASATLRRNVTGAAASLFTNAAAGDLHLAAGASRAIDQGEARSDVTDDIDGDPRPQGAGFDVGADEFRSSTAPAPLQISGVVRDGAGAGVPGVTLTLAGDGRTVQTGNTGSYAFSGLTSGRTYSVTPTMAGVIFSPASLQFSALSQSTSTGNFTAARAVLSVALSNPAEGSAFAAPATIEVMANALSNAAPVKQVDFYADGILAGSDTSAPFSQTLSNLPVGRYALHAVARDGVGATAISSTVNVEVTAPTTTEIIRLDAKAVGNQESRSVSTVSTARFSTSTANQLLLALIGADEPTGVKQSVQSVSGGGLTWSRVVRTNASQGTAEVWRAFAPAKLSDVRVTANLRHPAASSITVISLTGIDRSTTDGSGAIGATAQASAPRGAAAASLVTTRHNSWVIGVGNDWDRAVPRALGPGQIMLHQFLANVGDTIWVQATTAPTPLSGTRVTLNTTAPTSDQYNFSIVEILAGTGTQPPGPAPTPPTAPTPPPAPTPPTTTVAITSPAPNSVFVSPAAISVTATASTTSGEIRSVELHANGAFVASDDTAPYTWSASGVTAGTYIVTAVALDSNGGRTVSTPVTITVNPAPTAPTPPPPPPPSPVVVTMTSPPNGAAFTAPASVTLTASVSGTTATRVEFFAGTTLIGADTSSPFSITVDGAPEGSYSLRAVAIDGSGTRTTSPSITIAVNAAPPGGETPSGTLLQLGNLVYEGAFKVPTGTIGSSSFAYGGTALAFNSARNSLFIVGHDHHQRVAEISIPAIRTGSLSNLATASVLQPFADVTDGRMDAIGQGTNKVGGLLPYNGQLYATGYIFYDASGSQSLSHFVSGMDLSTRSDVRGPFKVGTVGAGFISGYFGVVPPNWRAALGGPVLNGNCCLSIISRTSYGPAVAAIDPELIGATSTTPSSPLVHYPSTNPLAAWSATSLLFNGTSEVKGVVFPEGSRSVLFFGRHGIGEFCYGEGRECNDPTDSYKGNHAYPYRSYIWAYDAADLAAVKAGRLQPWQVRPYGIWTLNLPYATGHAKVWGATYDPATQRIYLSQAYGNGEYPVIHVYRVSIP